MIHLNGLQSTSDQGACKSMGSGLAGIYLVSATQVRRDTAFPVTHDHCAARSPV